MSMRDKSDGNCLSCTVRLDPQRNLECQDRCNDCVEKDGPQALCCVLCDYSIAEKKTDFDEFITMGCEFCGEGLCEGECIDLATPITLDEAMAELQVSREQYGPRRVRQ